MCYQSHTFRLRGCARAPSCVSTACTLYRYRYALVNTTSLVRFREACWTDRCQRLIDNRRLRRVVKMGFVGRVKGDKQLTEKKGSHHAQHTRTPIVWCDSNGQHTCSVSRTSVLARSRDQKWPADYKRQATMIWTDGVNLTSHQHNEATHARSNDL